MKQEDEARVERLRKRTIRVNTDEEGQEGGAAGGGGHSEEVKEEDKEDKNWL